MSEPVAQHAAPAAGQVAAINPSSRVALDGRHPRILNDHGRILQLVAGHADIFAMAVDSGRNEGSRHHLFRVESGELILDLQVTVADSGAVIRPIAVGGPDSEAIVISRAEVQSTDKVVAWI